MSRLRPRASAVFADRATQILNAASNTTRDAPSANRETHNHSPFHHRIRVRAHPRRHLYAVGCRRVRHDASCAAVTPGAFASSLDWRSHLLPQPSDSSAESHREA